MFKVGDKITVLPERRCKSLGSHDVFTVRKTSPPGYLSVEEVYGVYDERWFALYSPGEGFGFPDTPPKDPAPSPDEHAKRKAAPLATGCYDYFPDALLAIAALSLAASKQHGHGKMHWEFEKSNDHKDCAARHLQDANEVDSDGHYHGTKAAWRALALEQTRIESADPVLHAKRQAQRDRAKRS